MGRRGSFPEAPFFYYFGTQLQAIRLGQWKLFLRQTEPARAVGLALVSGRTPNCLSGITGCARNRSSMTLSPTGRKPATLRPDHPEVRRAAGRNRPAV